MASDAAAHALANKNDRAIVNMSMLRECFAVRRDQLRQTIGPLSLFAHVGIIEKRNATDRGKALIPALHPRMRGRRTRARSKKEKRFHELDVADFAVQSGERFFETFPEGDDAAFVSGHDKNPFRFHV